MLKPSRPILQCAGTLLLLSFLFFGCQKEFSFESGGNIPVITNGTTVEGRVTDESGMPIYGAAVRAGNRLSQTDKNGMFKIEGAVYTTAETFITVTKGGYFKGSRTFFSRENSNNFLKVKLLRKGIADRIPASGGGDVEVGGNGSTIHFEPNSFATATGAVYNGSVLVATQYLDPSSPDIADQMPGDLRGNTTAGTVVGLRSFGMLAVEITDETGQALEIRQGSTATLNVTIPQDRIALAPATIPLWFFNDSTGLWKQEGSAVKNGDAYSGEVSHFSFWNCDDPYEFVKIQAHVVNAAGLAVSGAKVEISSSNGASAYDYTDANGYVDGFVPKNQSLSLQIINTCGQAAYSGSVGPFASETNLGNIIITQSTITIQGTMVNCAGAPVSDGYVQIMIGNSGEFAAVVNGSFALTFIGCPSITTAQLIAVDNAGLQQGNPVSVNITGNNINAGQLAACGVSSATFFNLAIGGLNLTANTSDFMRQGWEEVYDTTGNRSDYFYAAYDSLAEKYIFIAFTHPNNHVFAVPYSVSGTDGIFMGYSGMSASSGHYGLEPLDASSTINFTEYGSLGQFITASFTGAVVRNKYDTSGNSTFTDTVNAGFNFRVRHVTYPF